MSTAEARKQAGRRLPDRNYASLPITLLLAMERGATIAEYDLHYYDVKDISLI